MAQKRVFLAFLGLLVVLSLNGCVRTVVREELGQGLAPMIAQNRAIDERVAALEKGQQGLEKAVAGGFGLVGASIKALDEQTSALRQKVEQTEKETDLQFGELKKGVDSAVTEARAGKREAAAAKKAALRADLNAQLGATEVSAQLDATEIRGIRRVQTTENARVTDENETREVIMGEVAQQGTETRAHVNKDGDSTRVRVEDQGSQTRLLVTKDGDESRRVVTEHDDKVKAKADEILKALQNLGSTYPPPALPISPATP